MEHANCSQCIHSKPVIGSGHHLSCKSPVVQAISSVLNGSMFEIFSLLGGGGVQDPDFQILAALQGQVVQLSPHGVSHGWCNWPYNFDEIWITSCNMFKSKEKPDDKVGVQSL